MLTPNVCLEKKVVLVTGAAGFVGSNLVIELFNTTEEITIVGLDSVNDYYDVSIKEYRLKEIEKGVSNKESSSWIFVKGNLADKALINNLFFRYENNKRHNTEYANQRQKYYSVLSAKLQLF